VAYSPPIFTVWLALLLFSLCGLLSTYIHCVAYSLPIIIL
jgi:hypothetical protein